MCLSANNGFAEGIVMLGGVAAITIQAWRGNLRHLPLVLMPAFAGLLQVMEGSVWPGMTGAGPTQVQVGALKLIFFTGSCGRSGCRSHPTSSIQTTALSSGCC